jgi:hypothetical protein
METVRVIVTQSRNGRVWFGFRNQSKGKGNEVIAEFPDTDNGLRLASATIAHLEETGVIVINNAF